VLGESVITKSFTGMTIFWTRYSKSDFEKIWESSDDLSLGNLNNHKHAMKRVFPCVVFDCNKAEAFDLSAIWTRNLYSCANCTHWDGKTISFYCGAAGSGVQELIKKTTEFVEKYRKLPWECVDEKGALFRE